MRDCHRRPAGGAEFHCGDDLSGFRRSEQLHVAAYACAFTLSYFLNRTLNFRSHGAVGPQFAVYVVVVVVNYVAFILGVSSGLAQ
jgi:hypothetical protein